MKRFFARVKDTYFNDNLDFRAHIFNTLGFLGFALGIVLALFSAYIQAGLAQVVANLSSSALAVILIAIANRTKKFRLCFLIAVIGLFLVLFPIMFFTGGGYQSSMPCFFVFAIAFTVLMLEGWHRLALTLVEFVLYAGCFLVAFFLPETVTPFASNAQSLYDVTVGCLTASIVLAIAIFLHLIVYDRKLRELEAANIALRGLNHMKMEFLQDIRHEIQNPLLVISLGADCIRGSLEGDGSATEPSGALHAVQAVQNEAMRLGRMIHGMVDLATMSGNPQNRERTNFSALLHYCAEASRLQAEYKANSLRLMIAPDLPDVYVEAEQLKRVPLNLLANAITATQGGEIILEATADQSCITVRVCDTGEGIAPDLLPRVFQRGVSGMNSEGYGLAICRTIIEAHNGTIDIASEPGKGTVVTFTLPVYGGQHEVRQHG